MRKCIVVTGCSQKIQDSLGISAYKLHFYACFLFDSFYKILTISSLTQSFRCNCENLPCSILFGKLLVLTHRPKSQFEFIARNLPLIIHALSKTRHCRLMLNNFHIIGGTTCYKNLNSIASNINSSIDSRCLLLHNCLPLSNC